jgi:hypothetical protein
MHHKSLIRSEFIEDSTYSWAFGIEKYLSPKFSFEPSRSAGASGIKLSYQTQIDCKTPQTHMILKL